MLHPIVREPGVPSLVREGGVAALVQVSGEDAYRLHTRTVFRFLSGLASECRS